MFRISWPHLAIALVLFVIEVFIALFVRDRFVRPHGGDLLVVALLYFTLRGLLSSRPLTIAIAVLAFAFIIETLQGMHLLEVLELEHSTAAHLILGSTFQWMDILMYVVGTALAVITDRWCCRK